MQSKDVRASMKSARGLSPTKHKKENQNNSLRFSTEKGIFSNLTNKHTPRLSTESKSEQD